MRTLKQLASRVSGSHRLHREKFTFIDLFAGIGGLRQAFDEAGGKCVFTSEWDKYSRKTYAANYDCDHDLAGDIREVPLEDIPTHDVLVAGFPCQPFSIAGVSKKNALGRPHGFRCDTQGTLFFDVARILDHHRPAAFLLENVKNLISHNKGNTFRVIMRTLQDELGYDVHYRVINSQGWVPQRRERIFIAGFRESTGFSFDDINIPAPENGPGLRAVFQAPEEIQDKYTLTPRLWEYLQDYKKKHQAKGNGFGYSLFGPDDVARTLSARYYKDGSEVLIRQEGKRPRRLTPRECARLMGFDRPGRPEFTIPVSDTQAYKQFGNAVVVQAAEAVALHMRPSILNVMNTRASEEKITVRTGAVVNG
jgi:DNA (cytosine-5)-methyltransferase 1